MEDSFEVLTQSPESIGDDTVSIHKNLTENTHYSYYLVANNSFGSDNSTRAYISEQLLTYVLIFVL